MTRTFCPRHATTGALAVVAVAGAAFLLTGAVRSKPVTSRKAGAVPAGMVRVPGGTFRMGIDDGFPFEGPSHPVTVRPFLLDRHEVTVREFARFIKATGYKTEAEKFGWSGVFDAKQGRWTKGDGANWRHPDGPKTSAHPDEPVTHVSHADARAYAKWAGKRLPTEAEWEWAARGGKKNVVFPWGDDLRPRGKPAANWWQGTFPDKDTGEDGYKGRRAPVGSFAPNGFGLYDMGGNVWEWCADWFDPDYYAQSPRLNPRGPASGDERVIRGGSWMCSLNYCRGFRVAARSHSAPDSGLNNLGFRCAKDE